MLLARGIVGEDVQRGKGTLAELVFGRDNVMGNRSSKQSQGQDSEEATWMHIEPR